MTELDKEILALWAKLTEEEKKQLIKKIEER